MPVSKIALAPRVIHLCKFGVIFNAKAVNIERFTQNGRFLDLAFKLNHYCIVLRDPFKNGVGRYLVI